MKSQCRSSENDHPYSIETVGLPVKRFADWVVGQFESKGSDCFRFAHKLIPQCGKQC